MCSRPPLHLPPLPANILPPANKTTQVHKERAKDQLLVIQLMLSRRVASSSSSK